MNSKGIIGTIVVVGIVVIGAVYFMTAKPANASTNNAMNTSNATTSPQATSSNLNNNESTQAQNNSSNTNSNQNSNTNTPNNNTSNNQANNSNGSGQTNNVQAKPIATPPKPAPVKVVKPAINNGTGNFADIMTGANYMTGSIDNTQIIIPLQGGHVVNKLLILPEYYVNRLGETFTAKIASLGNNNFKLYEYYGSENTAIFNLKYHSDNSELAGTFTHAGSNEVTGITFNIVNSEYGGTLMKMPFYHTVINGTAVTITNKIGSGGYYEKYAGDNNLFNLAYNYNITGKNYQTGLVESYNGKESGEYLLNPIGNTGNSKGVFITHPGTSESQTFNVTLTGSLSPQ
ncbi:hypothetical protein [uncultured Clostridium sp.]|uniref:hypothetical protein n=1 Tax=uncultured Clostridium sp. TaxID=59620 RepID=UPI002618310A|nr:hypothetical protein [uncultured Clostridium sp.]